MASDTGLTHVPPTLAWVFETYGRAAALRVLEDLSPRDAELLRRRFFQDPPATIRETGRAMDMSPSLVSQVQKSASSKVVALLEDDGGERYVPPRQREPIDWDVAAEFYRERGWTMQQVGQHFGWCKDLVSRGFRDRGIRPPNTKPLRSTEKGKKLYSIWTYMHQRCSNESCDTYDRFGGQGVSVVPEWDEFLPFYHWACEAGYRPGQTLVMLDPGGDFEPANCCFGTRAEARRALGIDLDRTARRLMTAFGETKAITDWFADPRCIVLNSCVYDRMKRGWNFLQAMTTPPGELPAPVNPQTSGTGSTKNDDCRPSPRIDWAEAVRMRRELDLSDRDIAEQLGCNETTMRLGLIERRVRKATRQSKRRRSSADAALHGVWTRIRRCCTDPGHAAWERFGGRGVRVCVAWRDDFEAFRDWSLAHDWKPRRNLVRLHDGRGFSPKNCLWVTTSEVPRYTVRRLRRKSFSRTITAFGETKSFTEWIGDPRCSIARPTLGWRIEQGWDPEEAVSKPQQNGAAGEAIEAFGDSKIAAEWTRDPRCRVPTTTLYARLARGWEPERALTERRG